MNTGISTTSTGAGFLSSTVAYKLQGIAEHGTWVVGLLLWPKKRGSSYVFWGVMTRAWFSQSN